MLLPLSRSRTPWSHYFGWLIFGLAGTLASLGRASAASTVLRVDPDFAPRLEKTNGAVAAVAVATDGRFFVGGDFSSILNTPRRAIARFNVDGSLDTTFTPAAIAGIVSALAVQPDGKVVVVGAFESVGGEPRPNVARLNEDGTLDASFRPPSDVFPARTAGVPHLYAVAIQPDGAILVGGGMGGPQARCVRLLSDGSLDVAWLPALRFEDRVDAILVQSDGSVVLGGFFRGEQYNEGRMIVRLSATGTDDVSFNQAVMAGSGYNRVITALVQQSDGAIIAAGYFDGYLGVRRRGLVRVSATGALDPTYAADADFYGHHGNPPPGIALQADGKLIVGVRYVGLGAFYDRRPVRLNADGTVDATFDASAAFGTNVYGAGIFSHVAMQPDGHVIGIGGFGTPGGFMFPRLARFNGNGAATQDTSLLLRSPGTALTAELDATGRWLVGGDFDTVNFTPQGNIVRLTPDGQVDTTFVTGFGFDGPVRALAFAPNGAILAAGDFTHSNNAVRKYVARLEANGARDDAFDPGNAIELNYNSAHAVALQPDGKVVVGARGVIRLNANGSVDSSFVSGVTTFNAVESLLLAGDGKIIAGGMDFSFSGGSHPGITRLNSDGSVDVSFALGNGFENEGYPYGLFIPGQVRALAPAASGSFYAGGSFQLLNRQSSRGLARVLSTGAADPAFALDQTFSGVVNSMAVQSDGSLYLAGEFRRFPSSTAFHLTRLEPSGAWSEGFAIFGLAGKFKADRALVLAPDGALLAFGEWTDFEDFAAMGIARLVVESAPVITSAPQSQVAEPGDDVSFSVAASGSDLQFRWLHDGQTMPDATTATLMLSDIDWRDAGDYVVVVTNGFGVAATASATLSGSAPAPTITTQPAGIDVVTGNDATLSLTATGTGPLTYHWRHAGVVLATSSSPALSLPGIGMHQAGWYDVVVTQGLSHTVSHAARVWVRPSSYPGTLRPVTDFAPRFEIDGAELTAVLSAPDGGFFAAGSFTSIGGVARSQLAKMRADGSIDSTFVPALVQGGNIYVIALQPDGRLLIGGSFLRIGTAARGGLARLLPDGALDTSFDPGVGVRVMDVSSTFAGSVAAIVVQPDGRIIAGGGFDQYNGEAARYLVRVLPNGDHDPSFVTTTGLAADSYVYALGLQNTGSVVVGGSFSFYAGNLRPGVARVLPDGTFDASFNPGFQSGSIVADVLILPDDRFLVAGDLVVNSVVNRVVQLTADGGLDATFAPVVGNNQARSLARQADGRVIIGGWFSTLAGESRAGIARVNADGALDLTFAPGAGFAGGYVVPVVSSVAVLNDGDVLAAGGFLTYQGQPRIGIARLNPNGALDSSAPAPRSGARVHVIAALADNAWLVGGDFDFANDVGRAGLAVIEPDGALRLSFDPGAGVAGLARALAVQADGRILVGGDFDAYNDAPASNLVRVFADGTRDATFDATAAGLQDIATLTVLPDGRVWVGGNFEVNSAHPGSIARLLPDGTRDETFATPIGFRYVFTYARATTNAAGVVRALRPEPDGRLLTGGGYTLFDGITRGGVARLARDGTLDTTFSDPAFYSDSLSLDTNVRVLDRLPDGRVLAGGGFRTAGTALRGRVARLLPEGGLDPDFAPTYGFNDHVADLEPQADGAVIAAGSFTMFDATERPVLARLREDGSLDPDFGVTGLMTRYSSIDDIALTADGRVLAAGRWLEFSGFTSAGLVLLESVNPPPIISPPTSLAATAGTATTFTTIPPGGSGIVSYQWQRLLPASGPLASQVTSNAQWFDLAGGAGTSYAIASAQAFHAGLYRVLVTVDGATTISASANLIVNAAAPSNSRLLNLSTRGLAQSGDNVLIPGFVISGTGSKRLLIRAVGPTLSGAPFNLGNAVAPDPRMTLKRLDTSVSPPVYVDFASNDDWGSNNNAVTIANAGAQVSAFDLVDSREAALLLDLAPGQYTVTAGDKQGAAGLAIVELYDADVNNTGSRLINISNRGFAGVGDQVMIPGFVVSAEGPKTVLVRVVGPTLAQAPFGVPGVMTDPQLTVYSGVTPILANDNWGDNSDAARTTQVAQQVSAFPLDAGSADAAFVVTLEPGAYTIVGASADGVGTGIVLVEVYVVP